MTKFRKAVRLGQDIAALHKHCRDKITLSEMVEHDFGDDSDAQLLPDLCDLSNYSILNHSVTPIRYLDSDKKLKEITSNATQSYRPKDQQNISARSINHIPSSTVQEHSVPFILAPPASVQGPSRERIPSQLWRRTAFIAALLPRDRTLRSSCDAAESPIDLLPDLHDLVADRGRTPTNPAKKIALDL